MSAVAWEDLETLPAGGYAAPGRRHPSSGGERGRLALVPGPEARRGRPSASPGSLRITRLGAVLVATLALAVAVAVGAFALGGPGPTTPTRTVTVHPGQTLSEIAVAELPRLSVHDGVTAIQLANRLSSAQVTAGQTLVIPRS